MNRLRKIRRVLALLCFTGITLLFLDFTGMAHTYLGFLAKVQFFPAVLALNVAVVAALLILTLLFGRVYCSVICPLGVMQDFFAAFGKKIKSHRYTYSAAKKWCRYSFFAVFIAALAAGVSLVPALIEPYSAYGRMASNLFAPLWRWGNNALAYFAERWNSYAFYETEVWFKGWASLSVAALTLMVVALLSYRHGRTYCNTVCPVGTLLGLVSRHAWFKPVMDEKACVNCRLCERNCKASCIDVSNHKIDYSRCVACMDCMDSCHQGGIKYKRVGTRPVVSAESAPTVEPAPSAETATAASAPTTAPAVDTARRSFLFGVGSLAAVSVLKAQEKKVDGGLAVLVDKQAPHRQTPIVPPGAQSHRHLSRHCTACHLCVSACPNGVLRPSTNLENLMQVESSYERGFCRSECTRCSSVCPTGAIQPITTAQKSATQIGHAVWIEKNCLPLTEGVSCGNCARHCPSGAITMVDARPGEVDSPKIPVVHTERCLGCGACEYLCPSRPFSAIYVEGHDCHREI